MGNIHSLKGTSGRLLTITHDTEKNQGGQCEGISLV